MPIVTEQIARRSLDDAQRRRRCGRGGGSRTRRRRYQHIAQLCVTVVAVATAAAAARRTSATATAAAAAKTVLRTEVVVLHIGRVAAVADVVRVVHLHENVARLQADLAEALLQVPVLAGVVLVLGARRRRRWPAKVHIVPEWHWVPNVSVFVWKPTGRGNSFGEYHRTGILRTRIQSERAIESNNHRRGSPDRTGDACTLAEKTES